MDTRLALQLERTSSIPLHQQLEELIKREITSGRLPVGSQLPSEREICEMYQVSRITASRAMADLAREGLIEKQLGRGTFVADRRSCANKMQIVGIGLYEAQYLSIPFFSTIIAGVMEAASAEGYQVQLIVTDGAAENTKGLLYDRMLQQKRVDGLIIIDHAVSDDDLIDLHGHEVPVVLFDRVVPGYDFYSVLLDNRGGAFQLVEHLNDLGHRDIGFVTPGLGLSPRRERYEGYRSALQVRGLDFHPEWVSVYDGNVDQSFEEGVARLLQLEHHPTAIVFYDDFAAISAASALHKLGYRIPQDISITGFDNIPQSAISLPALTTIDSGLVDIGRDLAAVLLGQIKNEPLKNRCRVAQARLVVRDSTGVPPKVQQ